MPAPQPPRLAKFTKWHNSTKHRMFVDVHEGEGKSRTTTRYEFPPGETVQVPSQYDHAIQMVDCGREECHRSPKHGGGYFCHLGHAGTIVGGMAPLLKRVDGEDVLLDTLDPGLQAKKSAEAQAAAQAMVVKQAAESLVIAQTLAGGGRPATDEGADGPSEDEPGAPPDPKVQRPAPKEKPTGKGETRPIPTLGG